nr:hypothetical protein [Streptomyces antibioticus]
MAVRYGDPEAQARDEYARSSAGGIDMTLTLVFALLASRSSSRCSASPTP